MVVSFDDDSAALAAQRLTIIVQSTHETRYLTMAEKVTQSTEREFYATVQRNELF